MLQIFSRVVEQGKNLRTVTVCLSVAAAKPLDGLPLPQIQSSFSTAAQFKLPVNRRMRCLLYDDVFVNNQEKTGSKCRSKQGLCTHWFVALSIMNLRRHMNTEEGDDEPLLKISVETGVSAGEEIVSFKQNDKMK